MKSILILGALFGYVSAAAFHSHQTTTDDCTETTTTPADTFSATSAVVTSAPPTTSACTVNVIANNHISLGETCTVYLSTSTYTSYTDCGGCSLKSVFLGPGPVNECTASTTLDLASTIVVSCSPSAT